MVMFLLQLFATNICYKYLTSTKSLKMMNIVSVWLF